MTNTDDSDIKRLKFVRAKDYPRCLGDYMKEYKYQVDLTLQLDSLQGVPFDQALVNEIVLWKVNRYAPLEAAALAELNRVINIEAGEHESAKDVVVLLLKQRGVDLPMASTLLRFRNPAAFQIIDRRAYRAVTGDKYPLYPRSPERTKVEVYFKYLDELHRLAKKSEVDFKNLDRILYAFDKKHNGPI